MDEIKVTLAIPFYCQESFAREAVKGALAQTYSPLEIVLSDDCSSDRTFDVIQEALAGYTGPHKIILNRNKTNLGLARHENKLFELSQGAWIVFQGGDDISVPDRVERIVQAIKENPRATCFGSDCFWIDENGKEYRQSDPYSVKKDHRIFVKRLTEVLGATAVYHRSVYDAFGALGRYVANEDTVLSMRSALLGEIVNVPEKLVRYRKHGSNLSGNFSTDKMAIARMRLRRLSTFEQQLMDLTVFSMKHPEAFYRVAALRRQLHDDWLVHWFLGSWLVTPEYRGFLIRRFLVTPSLWWLFAKRVLNKMLG